MDNTTAWYTVVGLVQSCLQEIQLVVSSGKMDGENVDGGIDDMILGWIFSI
jgi:hypothetical protein